MQMTVPAGLWWPPVLLQHQLELAVSKLSASWVRIMVSPAGRARACTEAKHTQADPEPPGGSASARCLTVLCPRFGTC